MKNKKKQSVKCTDCFNGFKIALVAQFSLLYLAAFNFMGSTICGHYKLYDYNNKVFIPPTLLMETCLSVKIPLGANDIKAVSRRTLRKGGHINLTSIELIDNSVVSELEIWTALKSEMTRLVGDTPEDNRENACLQHLKVLPNCIEMKTMIIVDVMPDASKKLATARNEILLRYLPKLEKAVLNTATQLTAVLK